MSEELLTVYKVIIIYLKVGSFDLITICPLNGCTFRYSRDTLFTHSRRNTQLCI